MKKKPRCPHHKYELVIREPVRERADPSCFPDIVDFEAAPELVTIRIQRLHECPARFGRYGDIRCGHTQWL